MSTNTKISNLVSTQLPGFVREDHPNFVAFLEAYYEYLEQSNTVPAYGKTVERAKNLMSYADVDTTLSDFAEKLYSEYLKYFPKDSSANKGLVLKNVKDFYRARGSEKSFKFLMRVLFGKEAEFYYPKNDVLIASSGKWILEKVLRVTSFTVNGNTSTSLEDFQKFVNTKIKGNISKTTASVERVLISYSSGSQIYELYLSDISGDFTSKETITANNINGYSLTGLLLSDSIQKITLTKGGGNYTVGQLVPIESNTGSNAVVRISSVTSGSLKSIVTLKGGAGYKVNDSVQITGGGGTGASANVFTLMGTANSFYHANTINIANDVINTYNAIQFSPGTYGFPANTSATNTCTLENAFTTFVYGPIGPIDESGNGVLLITTGSGYGTIPTVDAFANTMLKSLGILGRMQINNGGAGYLANDKIEFVNVVGGYGTGAYANVVSVNATGAIEHVEFIPITGFVSGGLGYDMNYLPTTKVISTGGSGANISVIAILGAGAPATEFTVNTSSIGTITELTLVDPGSGYKDATANFKGLGDGTAEANITLSPGVISLPGRYLDDTGFLSSFNFLENRDYYQTFSYEIRVKANIEDYKKQVLDLLHPTGFKIWGQYPYQSEPTVSTVINTANVLISSLSNSNIFTANAMFFDGSDNVRITAASGNFSNSNVGTFSVWVKPYVLPKTNTDVYAIWVTANSIIGNTLPNNTTKFSVTLESTGANTLSNVYARVFGANSTGHTILDVRSNTRNQIYKNNWIHILSAWNLGNSSQSYIYLTDVLSTNTITFIDSAVGIYYNTNTYSVGATNTGNNGITATISELWFDTVYVDIANTTNRRKFIRSDFLPANVGLDGSAVTGSVPRVYFHANTGTLNTAPSPFDI